MSQATGSRSVLMVLAWLWVLIPFLYGVYQLVIKIPALF
ncbi:MFS transporter small subunit [Actinomycetospora sp. CA-084318]